MIKYDNCRDCCSKCEHAGKDREFVCPGGVSCKVINSNITISCTASQFETIKNALEYLADLPWWDIEEEQLEEAKEALKAVNAAKKGA